MNSLHFHRRTGKREEPFPSKDPKIRVLDNIILVISAVAPLANLLQIMKIFQTKSADGVSLVAWTLFVMFNIPWVVYGIVHKEKPLIINFSLWLVTNMIVVIGILLYG